MGDGNYRTFKKKKGVGGYGILTMNYGTCIYTHISEDVLTTTAAPSVTTVTTVTTVPDDTDTIPTDTIPNAVVVEINGFTPSTVKLHKLIHHLPYMMSIIIMPQLRMRSEVDGVYVRYSVYV